MVYIDVTVMIAVDFISGIQRVVREITTRLLEKNKDEICIVSKHRDKYYVLNDEAYLKYYSNNESRKKNILSEHEFSFDRLQEGDTWFDLDSTWALPEKRSVLLPFLKKKGVRLAVYIYDILPIKFPSFFTSGTVFQFLNYFGAWIQYGDIVFTSSQAVLSDVYRLSDELGCQRPEGCVSWLGADFINYKKSSMPEDDAVQNIISKGKYILLVGTIEPRKNHKLILDALDNGLNINVVFAGRYGWNIENIKERIENHPLLGKKLFMLNGPNDATIDILYKNAFLSVFPSIDEGFGLPIIESLKRKTPIIASDIPVLREVGGRCCDYFDPYDAKAFAETVNRYTMDEEEYNKLKEKADAYVEVTWDDVCEKIAGCLDLSSNTDWQTETLKQ